MFFSFRTYSNLKRKNQHEGEISDDELNTQQEVIYELENNGGQQQTEEQMKLDQNDQNYNNQRQLINVFHDLESQLDEYQNMDEFFQNQIEPQIDFMIDDYIPDSDERKIMSESITANDCVETSVHPIPPAIIISNIELPSSMYTTNGVPMKKTIIEGNIRETNGQSNGITAQQMSSIKNSTVSTAHAKHLLKAPRSITTQITSLDLTLMPDQPSMPMYSPLQHNLPIPDQPSTQIPKHQTNSNHPATINRSSLQMLTSNNSVTKANRRSTQALPLTTNRKSIISLQSATAPTSTRRAA